jgi:hypothetical protein
VSDCENLPKPKGGLTLRFGMAIFNGIVADQSQALACPLIKRNHSHHIRIPLKTEFIRNFKVLEKK